MPTGRTRIGVLGRTALTAGTGATPLSPAQRCLLGCLVVAAPAGATPEQLLAAVWGGDPPRSARASLHNQLTRLRRHLPSGTITWDGRRYGVDPTLVEVDVLTFARLCAEAGVAAEANDPATVLRRTDAALALWRGEPYEDVPTGPEVEQDRVRLAELRAEAEDARARALLGTGQLPRAITTLQALVRAAPHREQRWAGLMMALARADRRADALDTYDAARRYFVGELGLEPPAGLSRVHLEILRLDPSDRDAPDVDVDLVTRHRRGGARTGPDRTGRRRSTPAPASASSSGPVSTSGAIVGRDRLVAELDRCLDTTQVVVLTGEAGAGKSAVVGEVVPRRRRAGRTSVVATCASNPWSALQPVVELLQELRGPLEALDPPAGPAVWQLLGPGTVGTAVTALGADPGVLHEQVAEALERVAHALGGLTLVLDDAHRIGPTTGRLLRRALDQSPQVRLLAVTRQLADLAPGTADDAEVVRVPPLDRDAITRIAYRYLDEEVDAAPLVTWLVELTGGNALFVTALLADLARRGLLVPATGGELHPPDTVEVPPKLHDAIELAVGVLGLRARRALDVAAVLDDPIETPALRELVDPDDLDEAVEVGILRRVSATTLTFPHELMRRVAYDLVPDGRRVELHHAAATLGRERGLAAPQVAAHALAAAALDPGGAARAARDAGEAALGALAYEEAAQWFDRATEVAPPGVAGDLEQLRWEVEAADAQRLAGVRGHAERLLDAAERAVERDDDELRRRAVLAALRLGETGEPGPLQQRAATLAEVALARETDPEARAAIAASASLVHSLSGEPARCRRLFADALDALEDDDPVTAVQVLPYAYMGLADVDDLDRRGQVAARLRHDAEELDDPVGVWEAHHLAVTVALQRGDGAALRGAHASMRELAERRVGDAGRRWSNAYCAAALAHVDGDLEAAEAAAEEAVTIGAGVAPSRAAGAYAGQLLELRRQAGRLDELVPVIGPLVAQQDTLPAWRAAASLVLAEVDPQRSEQLADGLVDGDGFALARDFSWLASVLSIARGAVLRRDVDRAQHAARVLAPYADRGSWQGTCTYGPVALVLAEVAVLAGDRAGAAAHARTAAAFADALGAPRYRAEADAVLADAG